MNAFKKHSKLLSIVLALTMIFSIFCIMPLSVFAEETEPLYIRFVKANYEDWLGTDGTATIDYEGAQYSGTHLGTGDGEDSYRWVGFMMPKGYTVSTDKPLKITLKNSSGAETKSYSVTKAKPEGVYIIRLLNSTVSPYSWVTGEPPHFENFPPKSETTEPTSEETESTTEATEPESDPASETMEPLYIRFAKANYESWLGANSDGTATINYEGTEYTGTLLGVGEDSYYWVGFMMPKGYTVSTDKPLKITLKNSSGEETKSYSVTKAKPEGANTIRVSTSTVSPYSWVTSKPPHFENFPPKTETTEPTSKETEPTSKEAEPTTEATEPESDPASETMEPLYIRFVKANYEDWLGTDGTATIDYEGAQYSGTHLGTGDGEDTYRWVGFMMPKGYTVDTDTPLKITLKNSSGAETKSYSVTRTKPEGAYIIRLLNSTVSPYSWVTGEPPHFENFPPNKPDTTEPTSKGTEPTSEETEPQEVLYIRFVKANYEDWLGTDGTATIDYEGAQYSGTHLGTGDGEDSYRWVGFMMPKGYTVSTDKPLKITLKNSSGEETKSYSVTKAKPEGAYIIRLLNSTVSPYSWVTSAAPNFENFPSNKPDTTEPTSKGTEPTSKETEPTSKETEPTTGPTATIPSGYEPFYCVFEKNDITKHFGENFESGDTVLTVKYNGNDYKVVYCGEYGEYTKDNPYVVCGTYLPEGYTAPLTLSFNDLMLGEITIEQTDARNGNVIWLTTRPVDTKWLTHKWWTPRGIEWPAIPVIVEPPTTAETEPTTVPETKETEPTSAPTTEKTEPTTAPATQPSTSPSDYVEVLLGDAFSDGSVNIKDASYIQLYIASLLNVSESPIDLIAADIDDDGLNIKDVSYIQMWCASLKVDYKIGEVVQKEAKPVPDNPASKTAPDPVSAPDPITAAEPDTIKFCVSKNAINDIA